MLGWALCVGCLCVMLLLWSCKKRLTCECVQEPGQYRLVCKPSALATYLLRQCASFSAFCHVCWLWRLLPAMQTAVGLLGPRDARVHFTREYLQLADDGLVALDWALKPGHPQMRRRRTSSNSTAPLLLVIPNSFGRITRNTTKMCHLALTQGYEAVIFNRRCQNECPLSTTKLQQYGDPNDLREAIRYIRHCRPSSRLFAAAEGTGAGLLLSYLGECGSSSYITAAGCISPLFRIQDWFEAGCPWLWQLALLLYQKMYLSRYATALGQLINVERLFGSRTLKELEEALFCQTKGSNCLTWDSYWERNDPLRDIDEVAIPVLCICSQDDPIRGEANSTIPFELFETNPHFFLLLTRYGGHCGFIKSISATIWSHSVLLDFFKSTVDFFAMEDRLKGLSRRKGTISGSMNRMQQDRASCRKEQGCPHNIHDIYNWQRSYTR
ncbi:protein ABHD15-like [Gastrophryne carolinensis]